MVTARRKQKFTEWIGLKKIEGGKKTLTVTLIVVVAYLFVGVIKAVLITTLASVIAWFMGYINEKYSNGSIIPSWIIHTISNIFSGICAAFMLI